jgi:hypothetical protein
MRTAVPILIALLAACGPALQNDFPVPGVMLSAAPVPAAPGDSVMLTLENGSGEQIGYNLCTSGLERRVGEAWEAVPSDRVCTMELRTLEPGREATFRLQLAAELADGEYRFSTRVERMEEGAGYVISTDPFRIRA